MSGGVIGIDFGNADAVVAQARKGGIDVLLNENSNRKNPSLVSFQGKQRCVGEQALSLVRSNYKNTATNVKRILGLKWSDARVQDELSKYIAYSVEKVPDGDDVAIRTMYNEEEVQLAPQQLVCMILQHLAGVAAAANNGVKVADVVVSVPAYWNEQRRVAMLDALRVANINCLRLLHEHTAVALGYGIYKYSTQAPGADSSTLDTVLFVDVGHSALTVSVVSFCFGKLKVLGVTHDECLGGREFDRLLAQHLAGVFKEKSKIDLGAGLSGGKYQKSWIKLLQDAEKCKKSLSPVGIKEARVSCECLAEDVDLDTLVPLKTFEELVSPLVKRIGGPIEAALKQAGVLTQEGKGGGAKLHSVEIVGGGTRVPCVKRAIGSALDGLGVEYGGSLSTTLNADECVARGCALQCAILSSSFKVRPFSIVDIVPQTLLLGWEPRSLKLLSKGNSTREGAADEGEGEGVDNGQHSLALFSKGDPSDASRRVRFDLTGTDEKTAMTLSVRSLKEGGGRDSEQGEVLSKFEIQIPARPKSAGESDSDAGSRRLEITFGLDLQGLVQVRETVVVREEWPTAKEEESEKETEEEGKTEETGKEEEENEKQKGEEEIKEGDEANEEVEKGDEKDEDAEADDTKKEEQEKEKDGDEDVEEKEGKRGKKEQEKKGEKDETDEKEEKEEKEEKKAPAVAIPQPVKHTDTLTAKPLDDCVTAGMGQAKVKELVAAEANMAKQDKALRKTADARNSLEAKVYATRDSLQYSKYVLGAEKEDVMIKLQEAEDWLYDCEEGGGNHSAMELDAKAYTARLKALESHSVLIDVQKRELLVKEREDALGKLAALVADLDKAGTSGKTGKQKLNAKQQEQVKALHKELAGWRKKQEDALREQQEVYTKKHGTPLEASNEKPALTAAAVFEKVKSVKGRWRTLQQSVDKSHEPFAGTRSFAPLLLFLVLGLLAMGVEGYRRHAMELENPCRMTFSRPFNIPVPVTRTKTTAAPAAKDGAEQGGGLETTRVPSRFSGRYTLYRAPNGQTNAKRGADCPADAGMGKEGGKAWAKGCGHALLARPVVFIPGQLGSYKQVRSLAQHAAVAYAADAKAANAGASDGAGTGGYDERMELLYYALDFGEEPSALSGALLWDQAEFLNDVLSEIAQLHPTTDPSTGEMAALRPLVVGHSLGGLVARAAFLLPNYAPGSISSIVTLGTPHAAPRVLIDAEMADVYAQVNRLWHAARVQGSSLFYSNLAKAAAAKDGDTNATNSTQRPAFPPQHHHQHHPRAALLKDVAVVSLAGGHRDWLIPAPLCAVHHSPWHSTPTSPLPVSVSASGAQYHADPHTAAAAVKRLYTPVKPGKGAAGELHQEKEEEDGPYGVALTSSALSLAPDTAKWPGGNKGGLEGFSIDHQALLWCSQFLQSVTRALVAETESSLAQQRLAHQHKAKVGAGAGARLRAMTSALLEGARREEETAAAALEGGLYPRQVVEDLTVVAGDGIADGSAKSNFFVAAAWLSPGWWSYLPTFAFRHEASVVAFCVFVAMAALGVPQYEWLNSQRGLGVGPPSTFYCLRPQVKQNVKQDYAPKLSTAVQSISDHFAFLLYPLTYLALALRQGLLQGLWQVGSLVPGGYAPLRTVGVPYVRPNASTACYTGTAAVAGVLLSAIGASDMWGAVGAAAAGSKEAVASTLAMAYVPEWCSEYMVAGSVYFAAAMGMVCRAPYTVTATALRGLTDLAVGFGVPVAEVGDVGLPTLLLLYASALLLLAAIAFVLEAVARVYAPIHRGVMGFNVRTMRYIASSLWSVVPSSVAKMLTPSAKTYKILQGVGVAFLLAAYLFGGHVMKAEDGQGLQFIPFSLVKAFALLLVAAVFAHCFMIVSLIVCPSYDARQRHYQHSLVLLHLPTVALRVGVMLQAKVYLSARPESIADAVSGSPLYSMGTHLLMLLPCVAHLYQALTSWDALAAEDCAKDEAAMCPRPKYVIGQLASTRAYSQYSQYDMAPQYAFEESPEQLLLACTTLGGAVYVACFSLFAPYSALPVVTLLCGAFAGFHYSKSKK